METKRIVAGKIVAKLRNTVPVCLMEDGKEVYRYKNIEFPDELKGLEILDFGFSIGMDDKITFQLHFDTGVLPEEFPAKRKSVSWTERAAVKAAAESTAEVEALPELTPAPSSYTEVRFGVTGEQRKALVTAIGEIKGDKPVYQGAPSFEYVSDNCRIDKTGTLTGEIPQSLVDALAGYGFTAEVVA